MNAVGWVLVAAAFVVSAPIAALAVGAVQAREPCEADASLLYSSEPQPASIVLHIKNENVKAYYTVCVLDANGGNLGRYEFNLGAGAGSSRTLAWDLPPTVVEYRVGFGGISFAGAASSINRIDLADCPGYRHEAEITTMSGPTGNRFVLTPIHCEPKDAGAPALQTQGLSGGTNGSWPVSTAVYWALGLGGVAWLSLGRRDWPRVAALLGLFSRLAQPTVLQQRIRSQIRDLVASDPGIHVQGIADRLEVSRNAVSYHVGVLRRTGILATVELPGQVSVFVRGAYAPDRMKKLAVLRSPSLAHAYQVVEEASAVTLDDLRRSLGLSVSRASKIAKRLVETGLVRKSVRRRRAVFQLVR